MSVASVDHTCNGEIPPSYLLLWLLDRLLDCFLDCFLLCGHKSLLSRCDISSSSLRRNYFRIPDPPPSGCLGLLLFPAVLMAV